MSHDGEDFTIPGSDADFTCELPDDHDGLCQLTEYGRDYRGRGYVVTAVWHTQPPDPDLSHPT